MPAFRMADTFRLRLCRFVTADGEAPRTVGMVQLPAEVNGQEAEEKDDEESDPGGKRQGDDFPGKAEYKGAGKGGDGVHIHVQYGRHAAGQNIPEHTAAYGGDEAHHDGKHHVCAGEGIDCREGAGDGESSQSYRIGYIVDIGNNAFPFPGNGNPCIKKGQKKRGGHGNHETQRAAENRRRGDAAEYIPDHPAADGGHHGKYGDAEYIHPFIKTDEDAGKGKGNGSGHFKKKPGK